MNSSNHSGGSVPQVGQEIETVCNVCGAPVTGRVFDSNAWKNNTQELLDAVSSKDKEKEQALDLSVKGWICPACGFTKCSSRKHGKAIDGSFWDLSAKAWICPKCGRPFENTFLVAAKKKQLSKPKNETARTAALESEPQISLKRTRNKEILNEMLSRLGRNFGTFFLGFISAGLGMLVLTLTGAIGEGGAVMISGGGGIIFFPVGDVLVKYIALFGFGLMVIGGYGMMLVGVVGMLFSLVTAARNFIQNWLVRKG